MSFTGDNGIVMPVSPMGAYGGGYGADGFGGIFWLIIIFVIAMMGGNWGFGGNGGYGGDMQRGFDQQATMGGIEGINAAINAMQLANTQQMFNIQSSLQNCCCENRAATDNLRYTIAAEAGATRTEMANATQKILDTLCQNQIDAKNEKIAELQNQLTMANLAASQNAQTSRILADNAAQTLALEQYLNPTPIPAYTVQNPNCCPNNRFGCTM